MKISDILVEFKSSPLKEEVEVLTLTEKNGFVRQSDRFNKRLATEDISKYKLIGKDDFAFNPYLLWAGAIARNSEFDAGVISPLYPTFKVSSSDFDPSYIQHLLLSPHMIAKYDTIAFGSVPRRRRSSSKDFLSLDIPNIPPLEEQKRIAKILDSAEATMQQAQVSKDLLSTLSSSLVDHAVTQSQETMRLEQIATTTGGLSLSKKRSELPKQAPYLRVANVFRNSIDLSEVKLIGCTDSELAKTTIEAGDILMIEAHGNQTEVGRAAFVKDGLDGFTFQNHVFRIRVNSPSSPLVLASLLNSRFVRKQLFQVSSTTSGLKTISKSKVSNLQIPILDKKVEADLANQLQQIDALRSQQSSRLNSLKELHKSLQTRAFQGLL